MVDVDYVYQDVTDVPEAWRNPKRTALWGSAHALLRGRSLLEGGPFAVINAVNFYQRESFELLYHGLQSLESASYDAFFVGYKLANVLPESGGANRGICQLDDDGYLLHVDELAGVERVGGHPMYKDAGNVWVNLDEQACVSMNMWGLPASMIKVLEDRFPAFLDKVPEGDLKAEYLLPMLIDELIQEGKASVTVLPTHDKWYGMTYQEDRAYVEQAIRDMVEKGIYKEKLFE